MENSDGAPGENRTPTLKEKQILSLPRLPIPPQGQAYMGALRTRHRGGG